MAPHPVPTPSTPAPARRAAPALLAIWRWRVSPLTLVGLLLMGLGGAGDLAHHGLPRELALGLDPLVGPDGHRAHLAAVLGMVAILARVLGRALRR